MNELVPDFRQLRAFVAVAHEGSFTQAAKKLHVTQSAISHSLKALEDSLGCRLLDRLGKKTVLTGEGEIFLHRCRRVLGEIEQAGRELDGLKRWGQTRIRIGAPRSLCQFLLPAVLREFRDCFPSCEPIIEVDDTSRLLEKLPGHDLDLVFGMRPRVMPAVGFRPLFRDRMVLVVPPVHPWAEGGVADPQEFAGEQLIIYARATETHRLVEKHLEEQNLRPRSILALGDMEAIKSMVKVGIGVGLLAPWVAARELEEGLLIGVGLPGGPVEREWGVFFQPDRPLSLVEETLAGVAEIVAQSLGRFEA